MNKRMGGFTIIEHLIVMIDILATITIVAYQSMTARANNAAIRQDLATFAKKPSFTSQIMETIRPLSIFKNYNLKQLKKSIRRI